MHVGVRLRGLVTSVCHRLRLRLARHTHAGCENMADTDANEDETETENEGGTAGVGWLPPPSAPASTDWKAGMTRVEDAADGAAPDLFIVTLTRPGSKSEQGECQLLCPATPCCPSHRGNVHAMGDTWSFTVG